MLHEYIFYEIDESFDYADWMFANCTCHCVTSHGFKIDVDKNDNVDITSLDAYGDFDEMNKIKTLSELKDYLLQNLKEVERIDDRECIEELVDFITCQLAREVA